MWCWRVLAFSVVVASGMSAPGAGGAPLGEVVMRGQTEPVARVELAAAAEMDRTEPIPTLTAAQTALPTGARELHFPALAELEELAAQEARLITVAGGIMEIRPTELAVAAEALVLEAPGLTRLLTACGRHPLEKRWPSSARVTIILTTNGTQADQCHDPLFQRGG